VTAAEYAEYAEHPAVRVVSLLACVLLVGVLLVQAEIKTLRSIGNDFTSYLTAARALTDHTNPYSIPSRFPYSYPLTLAWMLIPFLALPLWLAGAAWFGIGVWCFVYVVSASARAAGVRLTAWQTTVAAVFVGFALLQIVQNELLNGQVNLVVAALTLAAVLAVTRGARVLAAALWGLAVAIKLFPLILVPWFVLRRQWTALAAGLAIAAGLCLVPAAWIGFDAVSWTSDYFRSLVDGRAGAVSDWIHLNLAWLIARLSGFAEPPLWLAGATAACLVAAMMLLDWRTRRARGETRSVVLYLLLVVLVSPKSETHHMVFTIPAVTALAVHASSAARWIGLAALIVIFNVGYVVAAVRDPFLLIFVLGTGIWCAYDLARR